MATPTETEPVSTPAFLPVSDVECGLFTVVAGVGVYNLVSATGLCRLRLSGPNALDPIPPVELLLPLGTNNSWKGCVSGVEAALTVGGRVTSSCSTSICDTYTRQFLFKNSLLGFE